MVLGPNPKVPAGFKAAIPQEDVCREEANVGEDEEGKLAIVDRSVQCEDSGRQARVL
jgi:hypothetical protein